MTVTNPAKVKDSAALWELLVKKLHVSFMGLVTLFVWIASSTTEAHANDCQQAHKKIQMNLKKAKALRYKRVNLSRIEADIAYLEIEQALLLLAKKSTLHHCDFSMLSSVGLKQVVSDDGKFRVYRWATDFEVPEDIGYATVMYAQPKAPNFYPAEYVKRQRHAEVSQVITIAKPASKQVSTSKYPTINDEHYPVYAVVERAFSVDQTHTHCKPLLSLFGIYPLQYSNYISYISFRFLDTNGKEINKKDFFSHGCDGDDITNRRFVDNQFRYNEKTGVLSFRLSVITDSDEEMQVTYGYKHYRFLFNGRDFLQMKLDSTLTESD